MSHKWIKTHNKRGLKPSFEIKCPFCGSHMYFRYSMHCSIRATNGYACNMHYKCPYCDNVQTFGVAIDEEYHDELTELRGKSEYTPKEEWQDISVIKHQLETLGYW